MRADGAIDDETLALGDAIAHQPGGDTARAIAALARCRAVGIPDAVGRHGAFAARRFDGQDLIATHPEVAVGQLRCQRCIWRRRAVAQVQYHEIVAGAVHFGETQTPAATVSAHCRC